MFVYKKTQDKSDEKAWVQSGLIAVQEKLEFTQKALKVARRELKVTCKKLKEKGFQVSNAMRCGTNLPPSGPKPVVVPSSQQSKKRHKRFRFWPFSKG